MVAAFRLARLRTPGRDVVGKISAVVAPATSNERHIALVSKLDTVHFDFYYNSIIVAYTLYTRT